MWATRPSVNLASTVICTLPLGTVASATTATVLSIFPTIGRVATMLVVAVKSLMVLTSHFASTTRTFPRRGRSRIKATLFARRAVVSKLNVAIGCGSRATAKVIIFLVRSMSTVASSQPSNEMMCFVPTMSILISPGR